MTLSSLITALYEIKYLAGQLEAPFIFRFFYYFDFFLFYFHLYMFVCAYITYIHVGEVCEVIRLVLLGTLKSMQGCMVLIISL